MIFKVVLIISIISSIECTKSYVIKGPGWKNEIKKCWSGGDDDHTYTFYISTMESAGFKYEDINSSTVVNANGHLELHTRASGDEVEKDMSLKGYIEQNDYKQFSGTRTRTATAGWATQTVTMTLTVRFHKDGLIELKSYAYAGSWGAVSCAWTKAFVETIEITY